MVLTITAAAFAQPVEEKKRWTARTLGGQGMDLFDAGSYGAALEKFKTADALVPAPTLKLRVARCLDKLDRMVESAAKYREAIEFELDRRAPKVQLEARADAIKELATLMDQIPTIDVQVRGDGARAAVVELDGGRIEADQVGKKIQVDPGSHSIKARRESDGATEQKTVICARRKAEQVVLRLPAIKTEGSGNAAAGANAGGGWRLGGYVTTGVSGAAFLVGAICGFVVLGQKGSLSDQCPDGQCPADLTDDVHAYDRLRTVSSVGVITGTVGIGAGVLMLLLAPSGTPKPAAGGDSEGGGDTAEPPSAQVSLCPTILGVCAQGKF